MSASIRALSAGSLDALAAVVGPDHVVTDPDRTASASVDWTGRFRGATPAVVRPATTDEVSGVLAHCHGAGLAVVPQGGNTGLVGGGVPLAGEVVLDLRRLADIGPVDVLARQVTVGAGVTVAALHQAVAVAGLTYAVDFAARDTATIGGTIATNAGGVHVLRWGSTRAQVAGIEAVLADGRVLRHLAGLGKDNTGYDLAGLLCGSEGTLAVVTAARLRLVPSEPDVCVSLLGFDSLADAVATVSRLVVEVAGLTAAEFVLAEGLQLVCDRFERRRPLAAAHPVVVLVEARATRAGAASTALEEALAAERSVRGSVVATDTAGCRQLWSYRDEQTSAINTLGPPHKLDVSLPLAALAGFVAEVADLVAARAPAARVWQFGHLGDGNVHVNVTGLDPEDDSVDQAVLELVAARGGSISAEHGIGTAKRRWLALTRSPAEIDAFRAIKAALDPTGILNPHALIEPGG